MNKKFLLTIILGIFLISFASAGLDLELNPIVLNDEDTHWDNIDNYLEIGYYGKYEIRDSVLGIPFLQLAKVKDIELKNNTNVCRQNCWAEKEIILYKETSLVDDIRFYKIDSEGNRDLSNIRNYNFKYWGEIKDYETKCINGIEIISENGTSETPQTCNEVLIGSHEGWINYELGKVMPIGNYKLRLDGEKRPSWSYDWQIKTSGIWTTDWALWNATSGLVSYWSFNDANQTTLIDLEGDNDGTWNGYTYNDGEINGATLNTSGKFGNAYDFDGGNDYIDLSTFSLADSEFSISMWAQNVGSGRQYMIRWTNNITNNNYVRFNSNLQISYKEYGSITNTQSVFLSTTNLTKKWIHLVAVHNGNNITLYVNGEPQTTETIGISTNLHGFIIGNSFNGSIDEVRIFDKALTQTEIQAEMNSANPVSGDGLVSSYSFEQYNGTHTFDTNNLVAGIIEEGGRFDGDNDEIITTLNLDYIEEGDFTACAWAKSSSFDRFTYNYCEHL